MNTRHRVRAFSLIEVIVAVGLFAGTVIVAIALLPTLARQGGAAAESMTVRHLPNALQIELSRLQAPGFDTLAAQVPIMTGSLGNGLSFVADRDGQRLHSRDYLPPSTGSLPETEQYFLIECWRFSDEPLRHDSAKGFLALMVRVSWPYRLPVSTAPTAAAARSQFVCTVSLRR